MASADLESLGVGVVGLGTVGSAVAAVLRDRGVRVHAYDKFKPDSSTASLEDVAQQTAVLFLCLPTPYSDVEKRYDQSAVREVLDLLATTHRYRGVVVLKSTVDVGTSEAAATATGLEVVHNPEFLTARTAAEDFRQQPHVVLGRTSTSTDAGLRRLTELYTRLCPDATVSHCTSPESELMKLSVNTFYATKVMFFNELYLLCAKLGLEYRTVRDLMLRNGWISAMHTEVPGPDGRLAYGGACFPKDTSAFLSMLQRAEVPHAVVSAAIAERNQIRPEP